MTCKNCNTLNEEEANYCINCGIRLNHLTTYKARKVIISDWLLFAFMFIFIITEINLASSLNDMEETLGFSPKYWYLINLFLGHLAFILIPLSVKNKNIKLLFGVIFMLFIALRAYYMYTQFPWWILE